MPSGRGWRGTWPRGHAHGAQPPSMKQAPGLGGDKKVADDAKKQTMHDDQACIMYRTGMYSNHPALYFLLIYYCRCNFITGKSPSLRTTPAVLLSPPSILLSLDFLTSRSLNGGSLLTVVSQYTIERSKQAVSNAASIKTSLFNLMSRH